MTVHLRYWLAIAAVLVLPIEGEAQNTSAFTSGNEVYSACTSPSSQIVAVKTCLTYVAGVLDAITMMQDEHMARRTVCSAMGVSIDQVKDVSVRWLANHPEARHHSAASLLLAAFQEAWPCTH